MEVHAHTHTPRNKWTHYFWEFFMLFMAVSAGFLVENQREHYVEHKRANAYAKNLHEELKSDTVRLNVVIQLNNYFTRKLDTFCLYATEKEKRNVTNGMLYYYAKFTTYVDYFSPNNATIEELKGSGNLRLMKNNVAHKISEYDKMFRELENEYSLSRTEFEKFETLYFKLFDGYITHLISPGMDIYVNRDSVFSLNLPFISDDPKLMKEFVGWLKFRNNIHVMQKNKYHLPIKQSATELIALLKKEYRLD